LAPVRAKVSDVLFISFERPPRSLNMVSCPVFSCGMS